MGLAPALLASYVVGSIPVSFLVCKLAFGVDLREVGSRNVGATNALRTVGPRAAIPALAGDALKGTLAVLLARWMVPEGGAPTGMARDLLAGGTAVLGHSFTVFLRFRGGKGVATAAGVFLAIAPGPLALSLAVFVVAVGLTRFVSLGSILASASLPLWIVLLAPPGSAVLCVAACLIAIFILVRHAENVRRLLAGTESKIQFGNPARAGESGGDNPPGAPSAQASSPHGVVSRDSATAVSASAQGSAPEGAPAAVPSSAPGTSAPVSSASPTATSAVEDGAPGGGAAAVAGRGRGVRPARGGGAP